MKTKQDVITQAQAIGSTATTLAGSIRYLRTHWDRHIRAISPRDSGHNRGAQDVAEYQRMRDERRAQHICDAIDMPNREDSDAIMTALGTGLTHWYGLWTLDEMETTLQVYEQRLQSEILTIVKSFWPYRRSQSNWAGGDHVVTITLGDAPAVDAGSERVWSDNRKWSGTDSYAHLTITHRAIRTLGATRLMIGGILTVDAEQVGMREYRASWLEQSTGFGLKLIDGYIIRGYHVHTNDLKAARSTAARARKKSLSAVLATRQERRRRRAELASYASIWVGVQDSIDAGNCPTGTAQAEKMFRGKLHADGELGGIRADVLLSLRDDTYTRRAISAAMRRFMKEVA